MYRYLIVFVFHIIFRKFFKTDLRPFLIKRFLSFRYEISNSMENDLIPDESIKFFKENILENTSLYSKKNDKRALWENHRLDIINSDKFSLKIRTGILLLWINYSKRFDLIVFENMMEASLRSSNILIFLVKNKDNLSKEIIKTLMGILRNTFLLNIYAPDMFIKRDVLRILDHSNNHFIFCLCFQLLYMNYKQPLSQTKIKKFLNYFEKKFSIDGFLKEGSTFYSYSVSNAILKVLFFLDFKDIKRFERLYKSFCISTNDDIHLKNLNIGDRDGTILLPNTDSNPDFANYIDRQAFDNFHPFNNLSLIKKNNLKIIVNHRKVYDYGSLGHYHDDYGHFNLYHKDQIIYDPGTFSYSSEDKRFDSSVYHNAITIDESDSMIHKQKFEKVFNSKIKTEIKNGTLKLSKYDSHGKWKREFKQNSLTFYDQFTFSRTPILNIFFKLQPEIFPINSKEIEIVTENIKIEISCNELLNYNIQKTIIAEDYLKHFVGYHLKISFKKYIENRLEWKVKCLN